ncbi:MAG: hypothetical protein GY946_00130 [bacterium]|nr:hypothetical protein [bacterium]
MFTTPRTYVFTSVLVGLLAVDAATQQLGFTLSKTARCSVANKAPSNFPVCAGTQEILAGTVIDATTQLQCTASSTRASASLRIDGFQGGLTAFARVAGSSNSQTQRRSGVTDASASCDSGFPTQIRIVPPPCGFDLVIDASNSGGGGNNQIDGTHIDIRNSASSLLFQWNSTNAGQRGTSPTVTLRRPARTGSSSYLYINLRAWQAATLGSGAIDRQMSVTVRVVPVKPACSGSVLKGNCPAQLIQSVRCDRVIGLTAYSPPHAGGNAFLFAGFPTSPLPLWSCLLHIQVPIYVEQAPINSLGQAQFSPLTVPGALAFDATLQAIVYHPAIGLELTDAHRIRCPFP